MTLRLEIDDNAFTVHRLSSARGSVLVDTRVKVKEDFTFIISFRGVVVDPHNILLRGSLTSTIYSKHSLHIPSHMRTNLYAVLV